MLLAKLLSKIFKKNGVILIDADEQKYICGKPNFENPLTIKLLKKNLNWKLALSPDTNFPEAYIKGDIEIENGSLLDFLNMAFENIGRNEITKSAYVLKKIMHVWRFLTNYNVPTKAKKDISITKEVLPKILDDVLESKQSITEIQPPVNTIKAYKLFTVKSFSIKILKLNLAV